MVAKQLLRAVVSMFVGLAAVQGCALDDPDLESELEFGLHDPPTSLSATATAPDRITVSWTPAATGTKTYVYESATGGPFTIVGSVLFPGTSLPRAGRMPATMYCYVARTDGPEGLSPASAPACTTTPGATLPVPTGVTAMATSSDRIFVSWNAVSGANRYYVHQSVGAAGPYTLVNTVLSPGTSVQVANLTSATNYCFQIQAANSSGATSAMSPPTCASTFGAGLEGFWKFNEGAGTSIEDSSGWLRGGSIQGNVAYTADKPPMDNNPFALAFGGGAGDAASIPHNTVFRLAGNFTVTAWVKLEAAPSGTLRIAGKRLPGCGTTNWELAQDATNGLHLRGANVAAFGATLPVGAWTHVTVTHTAGTATLYLDGVAAGSAAFTVGPNITSTLEIGNSGGCGSAPALIDHVAIYTRALTPTEVGDLGTPPAAPTNLVATATSAKHVQLTWDPVPGASKYLLYKGTTSGDQVLFASLLAPTVSFSDSTNQPSTQTSWFVRAVENGLISDSSNEQIVSTLPPPPAPGNVTATALTSTRIQLTWDAVPNAVKYYIYQSTGGGPFVIKGSVLASSPTPTSFVAAALTANTQYTYYLVSDDGVVVSAQSSTVSATTLP